MKGYITYIDIKIHKTEGGSMNLLQFNILDGCPDKDRFQKFDNWMKKQDYDAIGFNELNGWNADKLERKSKEWGYDYSYIFEMETSPYFVGVISKHPLEVINTDEDNFYHGLLHVKTKGTHILIAHLTPFESAMREKETAKIAEFVQGMTEPVVVMGDMNTLSPLDKDYYEKENIATYLADKKVLANQHLVDGKINYTPMNTLLQAGLYDIGFLGDFTSSFPSSLKHDLTKARQLRIDYVLVNGVFMKSHPIAEIIKNEEVEELSDHYPIQSISYLDEGEL